MTTNTMIAFHAAIINGSVWAASTRDDSTWHAVFWLVTAFAVLLFGDITITWGKDIASKEGK